MLIENTGEVIKVLARLFIEESKTHGTNGKRRKNKIYDIFGSKPLIN